MAGLFPNRFRRRTLRGTLRLLLLLILVPVLAVQVGIYWSWYRAQRQREVEGNLEMARAVAGTLEAYVQDLLRQERSIGLTFGSLRSMTAEQMTHYLSTVARNYPAVRNLAWTDAEGVVLASTEPKGVGVVARDRSPFARLLAGGDWVLTDLTLSRLTGKPTFGVLRSARDGAGRLQGIVAAYVDPERLGEVLKVERAGGGAILVLDRTGRVVYRSRSPLTWEERDWAKRSPVVLRALGGREATSIVRSGFDDRRRIVAVVPVPSTGWLIGASRESSAVLGPIWRGVFRDSLLFLLVAAAAWVVATLTARRLAGNLGRLRDEASAFASGPLEAEVAVEGPEEFVQLADSFNRMGRELRAREAERARFAAAERQALADASAAYERTHRVLESIGEPFFSFDAAWRFTYINREAERVWRRRREEMLGRAIFDVFPEEREEGFYRHFREALATALPVSFEVRSGTSGRWTEARAYPFEGGLWVYFRDVDDRRRTQDEREALIRRVETEHAKLEAVLQQMPLGVMIVEAPTGRILHASTEMERILGHSAAGEDHVPWGRRRRGLHADGRPYEPEEWPLVRSMRRAEVVCGEEVTVLSGEGSSRILSISSAPIRDADGGTSAAVCIIEDVTENKRLQEQLFQAQKMESLGYLAAGVAHDFNNLLAVVAGNAELALLAVPPEAPAVRHLAQIETAARRAAELTDKMLDYAGENPSALEKVDLSRVVGEAAESLDPALPVGVTLHRELAAGLPPVDADPSQMRRVIVGLLTNASEAIGAEGSGEIRLRTGALSLGPTASLDGYRGHAPGEGAYVLLEVSDTGCGMDETTKERLFDPFYSTKFTGRGLGLAAVLGIIRSHGGAIGVESAPGRGATFRVLLPAATAGEESVALPVAGAGAAAGAPGFRGAVLVVDDEEQVREIVRPVLEAIGFVVLEAADGAEGVARFRERSAEVATVLLDMTMPRMGGPEAFREIHRLRPEVPVIVASGYPRQDTAAHFAEQQPAAFIQKPFRLRDLEEVVRRVTRERVDGEAGRG